MTSALFLVVAALLLSGATYKAVGVWAEPSRPGWAFTATLYALGLAHVLRAPVIARGNRGDHLSLVSLTDPAGGLE